MQIFPYGLLSYMMVAEVLADGAERIHGGHRPAMQTTAMSCRQAEIGQV